jgi:hypothetical protein
MGGACSTHISDQNSYKILVEKHEGRRQRERDTCKFEDNNKMSVKL